MAHRFARVPTCAVLALLVLAATPMRSDVAVAQGEPLYEVTGFREARFGMTEWEVRQIAKRTFRVDEGDMTLAGDRIFGTTSLIVHVRAQGLESGLGEGRVEYVFGYRNHKLFQVNAIWGLDTNPQLNNNAMLAGAMRLMRYFLGFSWADRSLRVAEPLDGRSILLFSGMDLRAGEVWLVIEDVRYQLFTDGLVRLVPESDAPTKLMVSYRDNNAYDVREVSPGEF
jgi:hypothetical protein